MILPGWILTGIGAGFGLPTLTGSATVGLPAHVSAVGSAVIQVSRQLGTVRAGMVDCRGGMRHRRYQRAGPQPAKAPE